MTSHRIERLWEAAGLVPATMRAGLIPASWLFRSAVAIRNRLYDAGALATHSLGLPTASVGNLTVGGTGKTPFAAWFAVRLSACGARPAILLRGYGGDEPEVHRRLAPHAIVVPGADRVASARQARALGATVIVMDDAFQHRRAGRDADIVLLSADRHHALQLLPAGPYREPVHALRRATHVVVTRKAVSSARAAEVAEFASRVAPDAEVAVVHLSADALVRWDSSGDALAESLPLASLAGRTALVVAGIGDPQAFARQVRAAGADVALHAFPDHHAFSQTEAAGLVRDAATRDFLVCTLKDAVRLAPKWPPSAPPLWYLSQRVNIEIGAEPLDHLARRLATTEIPTTDSSRRPSPAKDRKA